MAGKTAPAPPTRSDSAVTASNLSVPLQLDPTEPLGPRKSVPVPWALTGTQADEVPFGERSIRGQDFLKEVINLLQK